MPNLMDGDKPDKKKKAWVAAGKLANQTFMAIAVKIVAEKICELIQFLTTN